MVSATFIATLAVCTVGAVAKLDKPALWPNLNFAAGKLGELPKTGYKISKWTSNRMSKGCRDRCVIDGVDPTKMQMYTVTLDDCEQPWLFCRQDGAPESIEKLVDNFARTPPRMRQWVNDIIHYKDGSGAYAAGGRTVAFKGKSMGVAVMIHEFTHCVDLSSGFASMRSDSATWKKSYDSDSAVPDEYARTNMIENLAQFPGIIIYDRFTKGDLQKQSGLPKIGHSLQTVSDQADWDSKYGGRIIDPVKSGNKCTRRWEATAPVDPKTGAARPNRARGATIKYRDIIVEAEPIEIEGTETVTNCTLVE